MPKVHFIKSARKDYPNQGIKKGDSYYKWGIKTGPASGYVCRSLTPPKPSDLTGSPFQKTYLEIQERIEGLDASNFESADDLASELDDITGEIDSLRDETESSLENIPEGLREGDVGQLLQERVDGLYDWVSSLQSVDLVFEFFEEEPEEGTKEHEEWLDRKLTETQEFISNAIEEIQGMDPGL